MLKFRKIYKLLFIMNKLNKWENLNNPYAKAKQSFWYLTSGVKTDVSILLEKQNLNLSEILNKIIELYKNDINVLDSYKSEWYSISYEDLLLNIENWIENKNINFSLSFLESLENKLKNNISILLINLWFNNLLNLFWKNILFWIYLNYPYRSNLSEQFEKKILNIFSMNSYSFEKSRKTSWQEWRWDRNVLTILKNYELIEYVSNNFVENLDIWKFLNDNKNDKTKVLNEEIILNYDFIPLTTEYTHVWYAFFPKIKTNNNIYLDSLIWIWIYYKNNPNAVFSFKAKDKNTLQLVQIQWIQPIINWKKTSSKWLHIIDWKNLVIEIFEKLAKDLSFKKIEIVSWKNNKWTKITYPDNYWDEKLAWKTKIPIEIAIKIYDDTAEKNWYILDEKTWNYKKVI